MYHRLRSPYRKSFLCQLTGVTCGNCSSTHYSFWLLIDLGHRDKSFWWYLFQRSADKPNKTNRFNIVGVLCDKLFFLKTTKIFFKLTSTRSIKLFMGIRNTENVVFNFWKIKYKLELANHWNNVKSNWNAIRKWRLCYSIVYRVYHNRYICFSGWHKKQYTRSKKHL